MTTIVTTASKSAPLSVVEMDANFSNLNADKLEDAPSDGTQYIRENGSWANLVADSFVETSSTKPSNPIDGQPWFSESNGVTYVYDSTAGAWVALGGTGRGGASTLLAGMPSLASNAGTDSSRLTYKVTGWDDNRSEAEYETYSSSAPSPSDVAQGDSTYTQYNGGTDIYFANKVLGDGVWMVFCQIFLAGYRLAFYPDGLSTGQISYCSAQYRIGSTLQKPVSFENSNYSVVHTVSSSSNSLPSSGSFANLYTTSQPHWKKSTFINIVNGGSTLRFSKTSFRQCAPEMQVFLALKPIR